MRHQHILPFLGVELETSNNVPPRPRIVTMWMEHGNIILTAKRLLEDETEKRVSHFLSIKIPQWVNELLLPLFLVLIGSLCQAHGDSDGHTISP